MIKHNENGIREIIPTKVVEVEEYDYDYEVDCLAASSVNVYEEYITICINRSDLYKAIDKI